MLLLSLFIAALMLMLSVATSFQSVSELQRGQQSVGFHAAAHLAEAGLDAKIAQLMDANPGNDGVNIAPTSLGGGTYWVNMLGQGDIGFGVFRFRIEAYGSSGGVTQRVLAIIERTGGETIFKYAVAGKTINLDGNATIGDGQDANGDGIIDYLATLYVEGSPMLGTSALTTNASNLAWTNQIDFVNENNLSLPALCPNCPPIVPYSASSGVFRQVDAYDEHAPKFPPLTVDLTPFYEARTMHITSDTTLDDLDFNGIIYVESKVAVTFTGTSHICGAIVHEGGPSGNIELVKARGIDPTLTIDSHCGPDLVKGMAIIGAPNFHAGNNETIDIHGFVMYYGPGSNLTPAGTIYGGLISVTEQSSNAKLVNNLGPGDAGPITWGPYATVNLGGTASVVFDPAKNPFINNGLPPKVKILLWKLLPVQN